MRERLGAGAGASRGLAEIATIAPDHEGARVALERRLGDPNTRLEAALVLEPIVAGAGDPDRLIQVWTVIAEHGDPARRVELLHRIAAAQDKARRPREALAALGRALKHEPDHAFTLQRLDEIARAADAWTDLAQIYRETLSRPLPVTGQVDLRCRLAIVYGDHLGEADRAVKTYVRVLDLEPRNKAALAGLERLHARAGRREEQLPLLERLLAVSETPGERAQLGARIGEMREQDGDHAGAVAAYREVLAADPRHAGALSALEKLFNAGILTLEIAAVLEPVSRATGRWDNLIRIQEMELGRLSGDARREAIRKIADLSEHKLPTRGPARAFALWLRALKDDVAWTDALTEAERLSLVAETQVELGAALAELIPAHPEHAARMHATLGRAAASVGDVARAREAWETALALDPETPGVDVALEQLYQRENLVPELVLHLERRMAAAPDVDLGLRIGDIHVGLEDFAAAEAAYLVVVDLDPTCWTAMERIEPLLVARDAWPDLDAMYQEMLPLAQNEDESADLHARRALVLNLALDEPARAADEWLYVLSVKNDDPTALHALTELYDRLDRTEDLIRVLEHRARLADPAERIDLYLRIGRLWSVAGRDNQAVEAWFRAHKLAPRDADILRLLHATLRDAGHPDAVRRTLRRLTALGEPDVPRSELVEYLLELAAVETQLGTPKGAERALRKALALDPGASKARAELESLLEREGRAVDVAELAASEGTVDGLMRGAELWEESGDEERAAGAYQRVLELEPSHALAFQRLESLLRTGGRIHALADVLMRRIPTLTGRPRAELTVEVSRLLVELGDPKRALKMLGDAIADDVDDLARAELGKIAERTGDWEPLIEAELAAAARLERDQPKRSLAIWLRVSGLYQLLSRFDEAVLAVEAALLVDPEDPAALAELVAAQRGRGSWPKVAEALRRLAEIEPSPEKRAELYLSLAQLLEVRLDQPTRATAAYQAAVDAYPGATEACHSHEHRYRTERRWMELATLLHKRGTHVSVTAEKLPLLTEAAHLYEDMLGDPKRALQLWHEVLAADPISLPALYGFERLYRAEGDLELALHYLERAMEAAHTEKERMEVLDRIEAIHRQRGEWKLLLECYRRHVELEHDPPRLADLHAAIGRLCEDELDDHEGALESYTSALAHDPEHPFALAGLARAMKRMDD